LFKWPFDPAPSASKTSGVSDTRWMSRLRACTRPPSWRSPVTGGPIHRTSGVGHRPRRRGPGPFDDEALDFVAAGGTLARWRDVEPQRGIKEGEAEGDARPGVTCAERDDPFLSARPDGRAWRVCDKAPRVVRDEIYGGSQCRETLRPFERWPSWVSS